MSSVEIKFLLIIVRNLSVLILVSLCGQILAQTVVFHSLKPQILVLIFGTLLNNISI